MDPFLGGSFRRVAKPGVDRSATPGGATIRPDEALKEASKAPKVWTFNVAGYARIAFHNIESSQRAEQEIRARVSDLERISHDDGLLVSG
jgi:hypothetical protein